MPRLIFLFLIVNSLFVTGFAATSGDTAVDNRDTLSIVVRLNETEGVKIVQPEALTKRLEKVDAVAAHESNAGSNVSQSGRTSSTQQGTFRVEVYSDNTRNAKTNAMARRRNVSQRFAKYNTQLVFDSPFWRVKVGPFNNRADAEAAMAEIRNAFPGYAPYLRIVRN